MQRKFFHGLAVLMFVPGEVLAPSFLRLSYSIAFALLVVAELARMACIEPVAGALNKFNGQYLDARDRGSMVLSHLYLLLGCAIPAWIGGGSTGSLAPYAGVLVLGVGDAMASIAGRIYGKNKWGTSNKSIEGTTAAVVSTIVAAAFLVMGVATNRAPSWRLWVQLIIATLQVCLLEAFTTQNDNLYLPIWWYSNMQTIRVCLDWLAP